MLKHEPSFFVEVGDVYKLLGKTECDTGIIENRIIKQLPDDQKRAFRVAKYLIQFLITTPDGLHRETNENIDGKTLLKLYGRKSCIKSYLVRQCFIHLLIITHDKDVYSQLSDGFLVMCLIDLVHSVVMNLNELPHPLLPHKAKNLTFAQYQKRHFSVIFDKLKGDLLTHKSFNHTANYKLLNSTENPLTFEVSPTRHIQQHRHRGKLLKRDGPYQHETGHAEKQICHYQISELTKTPNPVYSIL